MFSINPVLLLNGKKKKKKKLNHACRLLFTYFNLFFWTFITSHIWLNALQVSGCNCLENQYVKSSRITNIIIGMFKLIFNHVLILF